MLIRLLRRDWLLHRRGMMPFLTFFLVCQVPFVRVEIPLERMWLVLTALWASAISVMPLVREEDSRSTAWSCSLPVTRSDLVKARYVSSWAFIAGCLVAASTLALVVPGSAVTLPSAWDVNGLCLAATTVTVFLALMLPFTIRFGWRGMVLALVLPLNILLPAVFVVSKATGTQDQVEETFLGGLKAMAGAIGTLKDSLPPPTFYVLALLALILVNWGSYRTAVALFRRREL